jgi:hypothetical protein
MLGMAVAFSSGEVSFNVFVFVLGVVGGAIFILPAVLFRKWYFYRRRLRKQVITAEYVPPLNLNPAEIGYLFDGKLREQEVAATIIYLVQKGYLHLKKSPEGKKKIFTGPRIGTELKSYEEKLITEAENPEGVSADDLLRRFVSYRIGDTSTRISSKEFMFTQLVHADLQKRGFVRGSWMKYFLFGSFTISIVLILVLIYFPMALIITLIALDQGTVDFEIVFALGMTAFMMGLLFWLPLFGAAMFIYYLRGRVLGREWIITEKLHRFWPQLVGFRQYINLVEREKLEFATKDMKQTSKNDTLPYAVALGNVKNWKDIIS